ncbi:hypothetical protein BGZ47_011771 [Haplosporangium gracile]|nr:hypothetical protein BGZ47_011771 [Haplosporangium gracile]
MRFSTVFVAMAAFAIATLTTAAPAPKSGSNNQTMTNQTLAVLNYALTLEHLEAEFYKQGLANFNETAFTNAGFDAKVRNRFGNISEQENQHVSALTSIITSMKGSPVPICNYSFPMDNVTHFLAAAQAIENIGVSAYLGIASNLSTVASGLSGNLTTVLPSIATVEARHASYLNELWGQSGMPYAFDTPLGPREIATLATNFITSCPFNTTVKPFAQLNATLPAAGSNSTKVMTSFMGNGANLNSTFCQFLFGNNVTVSPRDECALPQNATGYVYVLITKDNTTFTSNKDSNVLAGPAYLFNGTQST